MGGSNRATRATSGASASASASVSVKASGKVLIDS